MTNFRLALLVEYVSVTVIKLPMISLELQKSKSFAIYVTWPT